MKQKLKNLSDVKSSVSDMTSEEEMFDKPRSEAEILEAIDEFFDRIWYDRKIVMQYNIEDGIEKEPEPEHKKNILAAMRRVEKKYGGKRAMRNYYSSDFEWGMMNGKLSALRWVLGDEWDNLDT